MPSGDSGMVFAVFLNFKPHCVVSIVENYDKIVENYDKRVFAVSHLSASMGGLQ